MGGEVVSGAALESGHDPQLLHQAQGIHEDAALRELALLDHVDDDAPDGDRAVGRRNAQERAALRAAFTARPDVFSSSAIISFAR